MLGKGKHVLCLFNFALFLLSPLVLSLIFLLLGLELHQVFVVEPTSFEGKFAFCLLHLLQGLLLVEKFVEVVFQSEFETFEHTFTCLQFIAASPPINPHW